MGNLAKQLGITIKSLVRQPTLPAIIVLTLALGIGASTALFAYLSAILWPAMPAPEPDRIVWIHVGTNEEPRLNASHPDYLDLVRSQTAVPQLAGFSIFGASLGHDQANTYDWGQLVSGNYFSLLGATPGLGRFLTPGDDEPGSENVAVLSHRLWKSAFGGNPGLLGQQIRVNGVPFTVVGVTREGFQGHGHPAGIYVPLGKSDVSTGISRMPKREARWVILLGRLAPAVTVEQAQAAFERLGKSLDETVPLEDGQRRVTVVPATTHDPESIDENFTKAAQILMAAALLFLLLGCANVANLLLARAAARQREMGIRASLGASRARLAAGTLGESLVLCVAGGVLGLAFAALLARRLEYFMMTAPGGLGGWAEGGEFIRLNVRVFAFAFLAALVCAVLCGLVPFFQTLRRDILTPLKSDAAGSGTPSSALLFRKLLVVAQVGLSVVLLLGGSLLVRTLNNAQSVDPGFRSDGLVFATIYLPRSASVDGDVAPIYQKIVDAAATVPGVSAVSLSHTGPLAGWSRETEVASSERPEEKIGTQYNLVGPEFFKTLGISMLQGRPLELRDRRDAPAAVVISRELARKLWGDANPIGRRLSVSEPPRPGESGPDFEVVGIAPDTRVASILDPRGEFLYLSSHQRITARMTLIVRASAPLGTLSPALREAIRSAHPDASVIEIATGEEQLEKSLVAQRMHAEIAGLFALLGLGVAVIGLFGLLSYMVNLRVREFGIRMAVGADSRDLLRLVLRQGMTLVAIGAALGLAGTLALGKLLSSLLIGIEATDPLTYVSVPVALALVALGACYLPARRAARLDPLKALRRA
jgi:predicted permease